MSTLQWYNYDGNVLTYNTMNYIRNEVRLNSGILFNYSYCPVAKCKLQLRFLCHTNKIYKGVFTNVLKKNIPLNIEHFSYTQQMIQKYSTNVTHSKNISLSHVKKMFLAKNMEVKEGYTCIIMRCIFCKSNNQNGHLFINKVTGYFLCTTCKSNGTWDILQRASGKDKPFSSTGEIVKTIPKLDTICEKSESIHSLLPDKIKVIMNLFKLKDDYLDKLVEIESLINQSCTYIYVPIKYGEDIVGIKELTPDGTETTIPNIGCKGIIMIKGYAKAQGKKEAVIVHNVRNMIILGSLNQPFDVISLPNGTMNLPQEILPLLENYTKITLWFGNEDGHWDSARHFAKKLNESRCYFVRPTEEHSSPDKALESGRNLLSILNSARPIAHKSITDFSNLREDILIHLQNIEKAAGVKWSRFPTLTKILKGHRRGEMTILTGPSGVGKTTFISEYSLDLANQGVRTLWGSFEIKNERLVRTMLQQLCRFPIHLHLEKFNKWADVFEQLPIYFMTFHGQQVLKTVMEAVEHAAYVHDISHVIIDNVQFMMGQVEGDNSLDRFYRQDMIIGVFRNFATTANCHVTLVIHPRKEKDAELLSMNSVFGGAKATQEADNVLIIQQKTLQNLKLKKFLQVAKNRYCGDTGVMPLEFDKESLSYSQKPQKDDVFEMIANEENSF